jgi:hypothetical protein
MINDVADDCTRNAADDRAGRSEQSTAGGSARD